MPLPDIQSNPPFDGQAVPDSTDWANLAGGFNVTGVVSGCVVTAASPAIMGVQCSAGSVICAGVMTTVSAGSVAVLPASASDRRDVVVFNTGSPFGLQVIEGTPCGTAGWNRTTYPGLAPVKPAIPADCVFLGEVYVASSTTSITSSNIEINGVVLLVTNAWVSSFDGRNGPVTLLQSDIESTFTAVGQLTVGTGSGSGEYLSPGSVGTVLTSNGPSSLPQWLAVSGGGSASAGVSAYNTRTGIVTSQASDIESTFGAAGQLYVGTGSGTGELLAPGNANLVLTSNGAASIPSWQSASVGVDASFTAAGQLYVGTGAGSGELLGAGSVNTVLTGLGATTVPAWHATATVVESSFTGAGQVYVGTGNGSGELLSAGSVGTVLTSNGAASVPSWQPAPSLGGAMTLIASTVLGSSAPSIVFSGIPGTYHHLNVLAEGRSTANSETDNWSVTINSINTGYDVMGATPPIGAISAVGTYTTTSSAGASVLTMTTANIGDVVVMKVNVSATNASVVSIVSSGTGTTGAWTKGVQHFGTEATEDIEIWMAAVTGPGSTTFTITYGGSSVTATGIRLTAQEFGTGYVYTTWVFDGPGGYSENVSSSASIFYPSLPPSHTADLYFGSSFVATSATSSAGHTSGYTFIADGTSSQICYNPACGIGTQSPVGTNGNSTVSTAVGVLIAATIVPFAGAINSSSWHTSEYGPSYDLPASVATAGVAGTLDLTIYNYASTTFNKNGFWRSGYSDTPTSLGDIGFVDGSIAVRSSTAAITQIVLTPFSGGSFVTGTSAYLYGIT